MSNHLNIDHSEQIKKRKLLEKNENVSKKANLEENIECCPVIIPIIADKYYKFVETEKMFVGKIISKKETSCLVRKLSVLFPLDQKNHLKRVRWTKEKDVFEVIIRPLFSNEAVDTANSFPLSMVLGEYKMNTTGLLDTVVIRDIPKNPALTFEQFKEAAKFWPVQFREDKYIEKLLKDEYFTNEEKIKIKDFMQMSITASQHGDEKVGCIVVDPRTLKVVAIAHDRRHHHPIQHAVMVATELVAKSQGGGSWDIKSEHTYHLPYVPEEIEKEIAKLKEVLPGKDVKKSSLPYLCTGYDLYISREPCAMCAMALVHSRIKRVFYAYGTPWGALGSYWKLHLQDGLNHHYEVFKVTADNENNLDQQSNPTKWCQELL